MVTGRKSNTTNLFRTTLTSAVSPSATSFPVASLAGAPSSPCWVFIRSVAGDQWEIIDMDGTYGASTFVCSSTDKRYQSGSSAASGLTHAAGSIVEVRTVAQLFDEIHELFGTDLDTELSTYGKASVAEVVGSLNATYLRGLGTTVDQSSPADLIFTNTTYGGDNGTRIYITPDDHVTAGVGGTLKIFGDPFQDDQVDYRDLGIYFSADQKSDTGYHGNGVFWINSKVGNSSIYAKEEADIGISFHDGNEIAARFVKLGDGSNAGAELERAVTVIGPGLPELAPTIKEIVLEVQGDVAMDTDALRWKSGSGTYNSLIDLSSDKFAVTLRAQQAFSAHYLSTGGTRAVLVAGSTSATAAADDVDARLLVAGNLIFDNTADRKIRWYDATGPLENSLNLGTARFGVSLNTSEYFAVKNGGSVVIGHTAAVATTADRGFLEMPHMAGTPTGTPTKDANKTPLVVDTSGSKLWAYIGGAWKSVTFA